MPSPYRNNTNLVSGLIAQDKAAIEYFFSRYFYGLKIHVNMDEDIAMEAFETALININRYNPEKSNFITWVYGIGKNLLLKKIRNDRHFQVVYAEGTYWGITTKKIPVVMSGRNGLNLIPIIQNCILPSWSGNSYHRIFRMK